MTLKPTEPANDPEAPIAIKLKYEKRYIAFLDVLGFSDFVNNGGPEEVEKYLNTIFKWATWDIPQMNVMIVSDSIIFTTGSTFNSLKDLCDFVALTQFSLALDGIWLRGGITVGDVYIDPAKNILVGPGFIRAVRLEKEAVFPRVIIDPVILAETKLNRAEFLKKVNEPSDIMGKVVHNPTQSPHNTFLFIDYFAMMFEHFYDNAPRDIDAIFEILKKELYGNTLHLSKYHWVRDYIIESLEDLKTSSPTNEGGFHILKERFQSL